ncbi:MAG: 4Fe-4S cluster-binding domain-containing protein [Streptosporangiales bacterium]|nr:4Fe-4S cluster-binding domain-containing protein [Streptosporangiales bacterium]
MTGRAVVWVNRFLAVSAAEGPGLRSAVWTQGCSIRCPGCFNPHTWSPRGGEPVTPEELAGRVRAAAQEHGVEGVTLLGGEPFDQAGPLAVVAARVRGDGLSVMTFTGHVLEDLRSAGRADYDALLDATDLLVDGPYRADLPERERPWVGSANQRFHHLTPRYADLDLTTLPNRLELRVRPDGTVEVNGFADPATLEQLLDDA